MITQPTRRTAASVLLSAAVLVGLLPAAPAQEMALRWKFEQGQKLSYRRTQDRTMTSNIGGQTVKQTLARVTDMTLVVDQVDKDGSARLTLTVDRIRLTQTSPRGEVKYDTATRDEPEGEAKRLAASLRPMAGLSFSLRMTPRGEISDVELTPEASKRLEEAPALLKALGNTDNLKHLVPSVLLPEDGVTLGKTWQEQTEFAEPVVGTRKLTVTYRYTGTRKEGGRQLDEIATATELTLDPGEDARVKVKLKEQTGKGLVRFDRSAGHLLSREEKDRTRMVVTLGGREVEQETESVVTVKRVTGRE